MKSPAVTAALWYDRLGWILWVILLVTVPVTSFPLVARLTGGSTVSPLAGLPMLLLLLFWVPRLLRKAASLPTTLTAMAGFVAAALASSALASFLPILPRFGETPPERELRAIITLAMGIGFYLVACLIPRTPAQIRSSLRWLGFGAALLFVYSFYQASLLQGPDNPPPDEYFALHRLFSIRDPFRDRVTGLAYEPSWLGNQLVVLYLPLWLASVVVGTSVWPSVRKRLSVEAVLLALGVVFLFLSFARAAWLSFLLLLGWWFASSVARLSEAMALRRAAARGRTPVLWRARLLGWIGAGAVMALAGLLLVVLGSLFDERLADALALNLRTLQASSHPWPYVLANKLRYAERLMYWIAGFRVFSLYPLFGVGLGNAGFLMPDAVPAFGTLLPELLNVVVNGLSGLPNPKSLWIRLLAETGIVGFTMFISWLALNLASARSLAHQVSPLARTLGLATALALVAQISEGFSLDTFALPQLWLILGLTTSLSMRSAPP